MMQQRAETRMSYTKLFSRVLVCVWHGACLRQGRGPVNAVAQQVHVLGPWRKQEAWSPLAG